MFASLALQSAQLLLIQIPSQGQFVSDCLYTQYKLICNFFKILLRYVIYTVEECYSFFFLLLRVELVGYLTTLRMEDIILGAIVIFINMDAFVRLNEIPNSFMVS